MNAFRVGLIGIGGMGTILQRALQRLNISTFAVMSRHSETGFRKAQQMGALFCPNLDAFVKSGVDIAIIATPTETHAEMIIGLVQRGVKKIFCEKPLARTMEEARKIKEICEKENIVLGIGYKMRFERNFMISKAIVEEGKIGKLQFLTFNYFQPTPPQPWYLESGVIHEILSHTIDLSNWFAGNPREVFCEVQNFQGGSGNDRAYLTITYQNGVVAAVNGGWIKEYPDLPGKQGRNICFQLVGEKGYLAGIRGWKLFLCENTHEQNIAIEPLDPVEEELKAFFEALSQDQPPPVGLKEGLLTQAVIESALKSATNGHREKIPIE